MTSLRTTPPHDTQRHTLSPPSHAASRFGSARAYVLLVSIEVLRYIRYKFNTLYLRPKRKCHAAPRLTQRHAASRGVTRNSPPSVAYTDFVGGSPYRLAFSELDRLRPCHRPGFALQSWHCGHIRVRFCTYPHCFWFKWPTKGGVCRKNRRASPSLTASMAAWLANLDALITCNTCKCLCGFH